MAKKDINEVARDMDAVLNHIDVHHALHIIRLGLKAPKDRENQFGHFSYRTASGILENLKPLLSETGCIIVTSDEMHMIGDRYYIRCTATLTHLSSNTSISASALAREDLVEKGKASAQMTGSSSTYAKKYALCHLFAVDDSDDDPDMSLPDDRMMQAVNALDTATTQAEVDNIKAYYADVMHLQQVQQAGAMARKRIGY